MTGSVTATIRYVQRDENRAPEEKPYILHYAAPNGFPQNNFVIKPVHGIKVHNLRTAGIAYEEHGIGIASLNSDGMEAEYFDDDDWVERVYLPELHRCVCAALGAKDMTIFDWMLHYTTAELVSRLPHYFGEDTDKILSRRYQVINIWKPLTGPCRDFPMAYLGPATVDRERDLMAVDEVFPAVANEVFQVRWNPNHKWYYVPDQLESEVAIFNAFDSDKGQRLAVPHCSFDLGDAEGSAVPRQSIEVRAFIFY